MYWAIPSPYPFAGYSVGSVGPDSMGSVEPEADEEESDGSSMPVCSVNNLAHSTRQVNTMMIW